MDWTKEQWDAISLRDRSILVSAAAGSGKTAVLVERIKHLVAEGHATLDEMLVVTFTNAAAAEMREKIVAALPEQAASIHKAQISTFHSFALDIVRRYFHLLPLEPDVRVCDEIQKSLLQAEAMDALFADEFSRGSADFLDFLDGFSTGKNEEQPKRMIREMHRFLESLPDPGAWLEAQGAIYDSNGIEGFSGSRLEAEIRGETADAVRRAIDACAAVEDLLLSAGAVGLAARAAIDRAGLQEVRDGLEDSFDAIGRHLAGVEWQTFRAGAEEKAAYEDVKEAVAELRDEAKSSIRRLRERYYSNSLEEQLADLRQTAGRAAALRRLTLAFDAAYRERKRKRGVVDFADIEHFALEVLAHEEAAAAYRDKYRCIFIDEYQDSNLVQESILERIRRRDNVFMVGDVKQSIYKFRLAEPEIFLAKYDACRAGADPWEIKLDLNKNFRSKGPVIHTVNRVFRRIMDRRTAGMEYDEAAALYQGVAYEGPLSHPVELHLVEERIPEGEALDDAVKEMKKAELEAAVAARRIRELAGTLVFDAKEGRARPLRYRDMVILLRSAARTGEVFADTLEQQGIPCYMDLGDGFFDTLEVSVFLNLLRVLDNRRQDVALLSVLRSPIFGFTIAELAALRAAHPGGSFFDAFGAAAREAGNAAREAGPGAVAERCAAAWNQIDRWRRRQRFLPLTELVWGLLRETGYYAYAGALPGGTQRQANLRAFADKAAAYESSQGGGLFGFIRYVEAMQKGKVATPPVKLLGESDDVVRILTVHKSKGLEFPVVILADLGRRFRQDAGQAAAYHKDLGYGLRRVDRSAGFQARTLLLTAIEARKARDDLAEEIRILYVAMTRAMDRLVLLGTVKDSKEAEARAGMRKNWAAAGSSYLDFLLPALDGDPTLQRISHDRASLGAGRGDAAATRKAIRSDMAAGFPVEPAVRKAVEERLAYAYPWPLALETRSKTGVTTLLRTEAPFAPRAGTPLAGAPLAGASGDRQGALRGTVYHQVLERIALDPPPVEADIVRRAIEAMTDEGRLAHEEAVLADPEVLAGFFRSPVGERLLRAEKVEREIPFLLSHRINGEDVVVQGIIDCFFIEGGEVVLLDYKTTAVSDEPEALETLAASYLPQLALYRKALEEGRGLRVAASYLYLFAIGRAVRVD